MAPRIYNLFPTLAGPMVRWNAHYERIERMGFDWVYVNPIWQTGGSRSLYAVADYGELDERVRGGARGTALELIRATVLAARARSLDVMLDLVMNHTADDSPLVTEHPEWYLRDDAGRVVAPFAVDPDDATKITTWGDLAELDYRQRPERAALVDYFVDVVVRHAEAGVRGFRCDAAYKVPGPVWSELIARVRARHPATVFAAETLGCTIEQVVALGDAGFDLLFNSSKWWDFEAPWLLDQYEQFRHIAPSIAFPESHDTPRLGAELAAAGRSLSAEELRREYEFRYLFAAVISAGVMMPMGYEYGFEKALDVVASAPEDWEEPKFDLSDFIARVNALKASLPALGEEGAHHLATAPGRVPLALVRDGLTAREPVLLLVNPDTAPRAIGRDVAAAALGDASATSRWPAEGATLEGDGAVDIEARGIAVFMSSDAPAEAAEPGAPPSEPRAVAIEDVTPQIDGGRFPIKRVVGDLVEVEADVFRDGHDAVAGVLRHRERGARAWRETALVAIENDRFGASFRVDRNVPYEYHVEAWPDVVDSWAHDVEKKRAAAQPIGLELTEGREIFARASERANSEDRAALDASLAAFDAAGDDAARAAILLAEEPLAAASRAADRSRATASGILDVTVDRRIARFGAWYEFFPRSAGREPHVHGTFDDAIARLPEVRRLGFDVAYVPPIHPIGHAFRKGPNNTLGAGPNDPGSPWAIGNENGGHTAIEPALGTLADFDRFVAAARTEGLEIALDYALQCSPDHPYVREHPEWFVHRPDGTIKYAENPPKKYQDIVNFDWYGPHARALWSELRDVIEFWVARGVTIFRVDNPHTKPFEFWEWMIGDVQSRHPEAIFLAEAFTRPKVMRRLAKAGFTQSYTYFTWRNEKAEIVEYVEELAHSEMSEYFRPNFFANTPDILPPVLQTGGRPAFVMRLILAATLSSVYGIYSGYEICESAALPGREEYLDSEKYEVRVRDYAAPGNINAEIEQINRLRREHPALHDWRNIEFLRSSDERVIAYMKTQGDETLFIVVNLDPHEVRETWLHVPLWRFGLPDDATYPVKELLGGESTSWYGRDIRLVLDPNVRPAAMFATALRLKVLRGNVD